MSKYWAAANIQNKKSEVIYIIVSMSTDSGEIFWFNSYVASTLYNTYNISREITENKKIATHELNSKSRASLPKTKHMILSLFYESGYAAINNVGYTL